MEDLTGFKRDVLRGIAALTVKNDRPPKGLAVKSWLQTHGGYDDVNHGRMYPNLNELAERGLVRKESRDLRTNEYSLTESGKETIRDYLNGWLASVDGLDGMNVPEGRRVKTEQ